MTLLEYWRLKSLLKMTDKALSKLMSRQVDYRVEANVVDRWIAEVGELRSAIFGSRPNDVR